MMNTLVPAAADAEIIALRNDVDQAVVALELVDCLCCAVGRVVVDNDKVELEVSLLAQHRLDGVADSADTVAYGDNYRCLILEVACAELYFLEFWLKIATDCFQVGCACLFHLNLHATVLRVYIVENLLATLACVELYVGIEILVDVNELCFLCDFQTHVVKTGKVIFLVDFCYCALQCGCIEKKH